MFQPLVRHGEDDQTVPVKDSAVKSARVIKGAKAIDSPGAPHGLMATHQDQVNDDLLTFLQSWWRSGGATGRPTVSAGADCSQHVMNTTTPIASLSALQLGRGEVTCTFTAANCSRVVSLPAPWWSSTRTLR
jgi:hypothetical protein